MPKGNGSIVARLFFYLLLYIAGLLSTHLGSWCSLLVFQIISFGLSCRLCHGIICCLIWWWLALYFLMLPCLYWDLTLFTWFLHTGVHQYFVPSSYGSCNPLVVTYLTLFMGPSIGLFNTSWRQFFLPLSQFVS